MKKKIIFVLLVFGLMFGGSVLSNATISCGDLRGCSGKVTCNDKAGITGCMISCGDDPKTAITIDCNSEGTETGDPICIM
jgi:hypothetical protein